MTNAVIELQKQVNSLTPKEQEEFKRIYLHNLEAKRLIDEADLTPLLDMPSPEELLREIHEANADLFHEGQS